MTAYGLNCTFEAGPKTSSTQKLLDQVLRSLEKHGIKCSSDRVVDYDIKPGVSHDEGNGDQWPALR